MMVPGFFSFLGHVLCFILKRIDKNKPGANGFLVFFLAFRGIALAGDQCHLHDST
jgi:hypothetical protein